MKKMPPMDRHSCECGDHIWTRLGKGFVLLISPEDESILDHRWCVSVCAKTRRYVKAHRQLPRENGKRPIIVLHRDITQAPAGMFVDHKNLNSLDNRRSNLRICTARQNLLNRPAYRGKAVPLKGVQKFRGKFKAVIRTDGHVRYLGQFTTPEEAHEAYVRAAKALHGEFFRAA